MNTRTRISIHHTKSGGLLAVMRRTTHEGIRVDLLRLPAGTTLRSALARLAEQAGEQEDTEKENGLNAQPQVTQKISVQR